MTCTNRCVWVLLLYVGLRVRCDTVVDNYCLLCGVRWLLFGVGGLWFVVVGLGCVCSLFVSCYCSPVVDIRVVVLRVLC